MRPPRSFLPSALTVASLVVGLGWGCGEPAAPEDGVNVRDDSFDPGNLSVAAGTTVTWNWVGGNQHNVTWVAAGGPAPSTTQTSGSYTRAFSAAGTYQYYCTVHGSPTSGMRGVVTVQ